MKPERIQLGLASLVRWRQSGAAAIEGTFDFVDLATARRYLRQSLALAESQQIALGLELSGTRLTLRMPDAGEALGERHLSLARAIESMAGVAELK